VFVTFPGQPAPAAWQGARRALRAVAAAVRECNQAQRRLLELRIFGRDAGRGPDTYAEFLFRSPTTLWDEPPATSRAAGARPHQ
jgi:hypothetical protein